MCVKKCYRCGFTGDVKYFAIRTRKKVDGTRVREHITLCKLCDFSRKKKDIEWDNLLFERNYNK
jgi:hypothetical protein